MSNEPKGPYRTGYQCGYHTVIDGSGVVVYSDDTSAGVNMFADAANYAHSQALTSQAARVRELYEALQSVEWIMGRCPSCGGPKEQGHASDCYIASALTPKGAT